MVSSRAASSLRWLAVGAVYVAITLAYAHPLLPVIGTALPNDTGDPGLNTWILWWNAHAVPLTEKWWNGGIFFPAHGAMALSETFLNLWPLSTPLQWAGVSAVLTYNLMFLPSFPGRARAHALVHRLTGRHDAAFVAGSRSASRRTGRADAAPADALVAGCGGPVLPASVPDTRRRSILVLRSGVLEALNGLSTGYYLVLLLRARVGCWFARAFETGSIARPSSSSLPLVPLLLGYSSISPTFGLARTMQEIEFFSADLTAIWATTPYVRGRNGRSSQVQKESVPRRDDPRACRHRRRRRRRRPQPGAWYRPQPWLSRVPRCWRWSLTVWASGGWSHKLLGLSIS